MPRALLSILSACVVLSTGVFANEKPDFARLQPGPIEIEAKQISSFSRFGGGGTTGKLTFRGGLVLTAPQSRNFGGWSGLAVEPDGKRFIAISDGGVWMTGTLGCDGAGHPSAIADARLGPLLGDDGQPIQRSRNRDSEAIALISGHIGAGTVQISFEQNTRILRYEMRDGALSAPVGVLSIPSGAKKMRANKGFEAMTVLQGGPYKGSTLAVAERLYDSARNHTGWIWTDKGPQVFYLTNPSDFDVTDVASLDDGTLFVLERRFRWLEGVKMRLRRLGPDEVKPGKTAAGEVLIEAGTGSEIDNMEGLAASRAANGETILTMISDDNFNHLIQRTVLLQFALANPKAEGNESHP